MVHRGQTKTCDTIQTYHYHATLRRLEMLYGINQTETLHGIDQSKILHGTDQVKQLHRIYQNGT